MRDDSTDRPCHDSERGSVLLSLLAFVLVFALGVLVAGRLPGLPSLGVDEIDRSAPVLLLKIQDLEEFRGATASFQEKVDFESERDNRFVPSFLKGERTTFLATGSVDGVVDFTGLEDDAVTVSEDRTSVTFSLPPARLDDAEVDLANSQVLDRERGVLDRIGGLFSDNPTSEREVVALAETKLEAAAAESDLRQRAEKNTRSFLTALARSLGFKRVDVDFDAADGL